MQLIDNQGSFVQILGIVPTITGDVWTRATTEYPEFYAAAAETATELGWYVDGVVIGQGLAKIPPVKHRAGAGVLLYWTTGYWSSLRHVVLQSHWPISVGKFATDPSATSFIFYYAFSTDGVGQNDVVSVGRDDWHAGGVVE